MHYFHNYAAQITKHLSLDGTEQNVWAIWGTMKIDTGVSLLRGTAIISFRK